MYLGDEAIVDLEKFSLKGRPIRKVRQSVSRLVKAGYTAQLHELSALDTATLEDIEVVLEARPPGRFRAWVLDGDGLARGSARRRDAARAGT